MRSAALLGGRFAVVQEFSFQNAKRSDMGCGGLQGRLLADCQEWCIVAANGSDKNSTQLQEGRFANSQEERFQGAKSLNMGSAVQH